MLEFLASPNAIWFAAALAALTSLSLLFANEVVRALGRIGSGIAWLLLAANLAVQLSANSADPNLTGAHLFASVALAFAGILTVASGIRKLRRGYTFWRV